MLELLECFTSTVVLSHFLLRHSYGLRLPGWTLEFIARLDWLLKDSSSNAFAIATCASSDFSISASAESPMRSSAKASIIRTAHKAE